MLHRIRQLAVDTVTGFFADDCLSRAAAIAYFTLFSIAPLLVIAMAIAGLVFGEEAVRGAVSAQLVGLLGPAAAEAVEQAIRGASTLGTGMVAGLIGIVTLLLTASGTFGELQSALNAIWKTPSATAGPGEGTVSRLLRARAAAFGLVAATGFLLLTSLVVSAGIAAFGTWVHGLLPGTELLLQVANAAVSLLILTLLFAAIYKLLPDRRIAWRDVGIGAFATALLFTIGKTLISLYIGSTAIATSFGAAGALVIVLVWVYYSSLIFLLGAEFTRAWASQEGSHQATPVVADAQALAPPGGRPDFAPTASEATPQPLGLAPALLVVGLAAVLMLADRVFAPRRA